MRREDVGQIFRHKGYPMRSHSETRWAAMMDCFDIRWLYEPRLFKTKLGMYLPDFYLPDMDAYLEVKGAPPTEEEIQKAEDVQTQTGCPVVFAHGKPVMKGLHLGDARLSSWISGKPVHVSLHEISQGVEKYVGLRECLLLGYAGQIQPRPSCSDVKDLLDGYLRSLTTRGEEEAGRAEENKEMNSQIPEFIGPMTLSQSVVFGSINWLRSKINQQVKQ